MGEEEEELEDNGLFCPKLRTTPSGVGVGLVVGVAPELFVG